MKNLVVITLAILLSVGCTSNMDIITDDGQQIRLRQMQTREYQQLSKRDTLRSVLATLQDLGFVIDNADYELATITATKLQDYQVRMTVTVRERESNRLSVRANARLDEQSIEDPAAYQDFFTALNKAMFLTNQNID